MLTLKNSNQIRTIQNIKSFRSCSHATGVSMTRPERARIALEKEKLDLRQARRLWRNEQWSKNFGHSAGPLRALPPSARHGQTKAR